MEWLHELLTQLSCRMAVTRAQHTPVGRGTDQADVPGMRCCVPAALERTAQPAGAMEWLHELLTQLSCRMAVTRAAAVSVVALTRLMCLVCGAVWQLLWSGRRSQMRWSGSDFGASRSGIASTDADGS